MATRAKRLIAREAAAGHREHTITLLGSPCRYRRRVAKSFCLRRRFHLATGTCPFNLMEMDEKRTARLFGLILGGLFAMSLILSAITI
jgi:hypothetical protein